MGSPFMNYIGIGYKQLFQHSSFFQLSSFSQTKFSYRVDTFLISYLELTLSTTLFQFHFTSLICFIIFKVSYSCFAFLQSVSQI